MIWDEEDKKENAIVDGFKKGLNLGMFGFEEMIDRLITIKQNAAYPPYNIERISDNKWCVILAVAGFSEENIEITLEGMQLHIRGNRTEDHKEYLHKGIANRAFHRSFFLAENISITNVLLDLGLLKIYLEKPMENIRTIKIPINKNSITS